MNFGKLFVIVGISLFILGLVLTYAPWLVSWFGNLPGDVKVRRPGTVIWFPLTSMLLLSLLVTLLLNLLFRK